MTGFVTAVAIDSATGGDFIGDITGTNAIEDASKITAQGSAAALAAQKRAADQARGDINRIFPQAQQAAQQGFQGALDIFGQSLPAQTDVFSQGNVGAQQAILSGLPQIQNALLGGNVDFSQLQPFQVQQPDLGFFNQVLPQIAQQRENDRQVEAQRVGLTGQFENRFQGTQVTPEQRAGTLAAINSMFPGVR